jgi:hypothetical protein
MLPGNGKTHEGKLLRALGLPTKMKTIANSLPTAILAYQAAGRPVNLAAGLAWSILTEAKAMGVLRGKTAQESKGQSGFQSEIAI